MKEKRKKEKKEIRERKNERKKEKQKKKEKKKKEVRGKAQEIGSGWALWFKTTKNPGVSTGPIMGQNQVILRHQKFTFPRARE